MTIPHVPYIDFTLLDPEASLDKYRELCKTAVDHPDIVRSVCVLPREDIIRECVRETANSDVIVCCVNDFPYGDGGLERKKREALLARNLGVEEIDTVINLQAVKSGWFYAAAHEIKVISNIIPKVKVILETGHEWYFEDWIKRISLSLAFYEAGFCLKTSTGRKNIQTPSGFLPDISLEEKINHATWMNEAAPDMMIKVAGGVRSLQDVRDICVKIPPGKLFVGTSSPLWLYGMPD